MNLAMKRYSDLPAAGITPAEDNLYSHSTSVNRPSRITGMSYRTQPVLLSRPKQSNDNTIFRRTPPIISHSIVRINSSQLVSKKPSRTAQSIGHPLIKTQEEKVGIPHSSLSLSNSLLPLPSSSIASRRTVSRNNSSSMEFQKLILRYRNDSLLNRRPPTFSGSITSPSQYNDSSLTTRALSGEKPASRISINNKVVLPSISDREFDNNNHNSKQIESACKDDSFSNVMEESTLSNEIDNYYDPLIERLEMKYFINRVKYSQPMAPRRRQIAEENKRESERVQKRYKTKMSLPTKLESISEEEEMDHSCPNFTISEVKEICRVYMRLHRKTIREEKVKREEEEKKKREEEELEMKCFMDRVEHSQPMVPLRIRQQMSTETIQKSYNTTLTLPTKLESISEEEEMNHSCPNFTISEVKEICRVYMRLHRKIIREEKVKIEKEEMTSFMDRVNQAQPMIMCPRHNQQMAIDNSNSKIIPSKRYKTIMSLPTKLESISEEEETNHSCPNFTIDEINKISQVYTRLHRKIIREEMKSQLVEAKRIKREEEEREAMEQRAKKEEKRRKKLRKQKVVKTNVKNEKDIKEDDSKLLETNSDNITTSKTSTETNDRKYELIAECIRDFIVPPADIYNQPTSSSANQVTSNTQEKSLLTEYDDTPVYHREYRKRPSRIKRFYNRAKSAVHSAYSVMRNLTQR